VCVIYVIIMNVHTRLTKKCRFGTSDWTFGSLESGWLAAFSSKGKKIFFKDLPQMDACINKFIHDYHFKKASTELVQQLSLVF